MARRRTKINNSTVPDPTPDRQLEHPSGWCMTSDHGGCRYQFDHGKCGCECHTQKTQKVNNTVVSVADTPAPKKRGRPKGSVNKTREVSNPETNTDVMTLDPRPWRK